MVVITIKNQPTRMGKQEPELSKNYFGKWLRHSVFYHHGKTDGAVRFAPQENRHVHIATLFVVPCSCRLCVIRFVLASKAARAP